jgi:hypothetical protein
VIVRMAITLKFDKEQFGAIMAALDDLKAAVTRVGASAVTELKAISDKLTSLGDSVSSTDVENAVAQINAVADSLDAETKTLGA